jgi:hypothetical protein
MPPTALYFILFSLAWLMLVAQRMHTWLHRRTAAALVGALCLWMIYAVSLAYNDLLISPDYPPRALLLLLPMAAFWIWLIRARAPLVLIERMPLREMVGLQAFRIPVELFLLQLHREALLPEAMTFHGRNFDILTGISALVLWIIWNRVPNVAAAAKAWNIAGMVLLAVVAGTGILSAPGPQHLLNRDQPNVAVLSFPYVLVAALFVLSAFSLHVLALRKIALDSRSQGNTRVSRAAPSAPG